jgi:hypothetical protein
MVLSACNVPYLETLKKGKRTSLDEVFPFSVRGPREVKYHKIRLLRVILHGPMELWDFGNRKPQMRQVRKWFRGRTDEMELNLVII